MAGAGCCWLMLAGDAFGPEDAVGGPVSGGDGATGERDGAAAGTLVKSATGGG